MGRKMAGKWTKNRPKIETEKRAYKPKLRLKSKNGLKNRPEKWIEKRSKNGRKIGRKKGSKNDPKNRQNRVPKIDIFETKPKLRLKSKNGPKNEL